MKKGFIIDYATLGAMLAREDDETQAIFFKTFIKELLVMCPTAHNADMQMSFVNARLTDQERFLLQTLAYQKD